MAQMIPGGQGAWLVRVFLGRDEAGKRQYHNKTIRGNRRDAQHYANKAGLDQGSGGAEDTGDATCE